MRLSDTLSQMLSFVKAISPDENYNEHDTWSMVTMLYPWVSFLMNTTDHTQCPILSSQSYLTIRAVDHSSWFKLDKILIQYREKGLT